eukprot:3333119-Pleurochrysis_carterae.AAC.1
MCVREYVRARVRVCVREYVRARVRVCVHECLCALGRCAHLDEVHRDEPLSQRHLFTDVVDLTVSQPAARAGARSGREVRIDRVNVERQVQRPVVVRVDRLERLLNHLRASSHTHARLVGAGARGVGCSWCGVRVAVWQASGRLLGVSAWRACTCLRS